MTTTKKKEAYLSPLSTRSETILKLLVRNYIASGRPVSSRSIAEAKGVGLSPATVRATMAELQTSGHLVRTHSSAGSMPTDKSFRLYIDNLKDLKEPSGNYKNIIRSCTAYPKTLTPTKVARDITKALSLITHFTGFAIRRRPLEVKIKDIRLIPVDKRSLLVVIVSKNSTIKTHLARVDEGLLRSVRIEEASNYLNSIGRGLTLSELREKVIHEMAQDKNLYDRLLSRTLKIGELATREISAAEGDEVYLEGETNIFDQIEFKEDNDRLKHAFKGLLEEKELLVNILDKAVKNDKVSIHIGSECAPEEFEGLSFVSSTYNLDGLPVGTIGIIGPVRMDYSRIIPLVDYSALSIGSAIQ